MTERSPAPTEEDDRIVTADGGREPDSWKHDPELEGGRQSPRDSRPLTRRSPIDRSDSSLASRDYRPNGGPKLVSSWLLGPPSTDRDRGDGETWEVTSTEWVPLQRNVLSAPHLGALDRSPTYLVACGRAHVDAEGTTLTLQLANRQLSGKPYETTLEIDAEESTAFSTPTVEFTPDRGVYESSDARHFPEYVLRAKVSSGTGYVNAGTNVQLWSE